MKRIIIGIFFISVLVSGCDDLKTGKLESVATAGSAKSMNPVIIASPTTRFGHDVADIMNALRFWINKTAWRYGERVYTAYLNDDVMFKDFLDTELKVKIYYNEMDSYYDDPEIDIRRDDNELENTIIFYISSEKENDNYICLSFDEGEHGFESEPARVERVKKIDDDLDYLTEENFYFSSNEINRPNFPVNDQKKELFLKKAKRKIKKILSKTKGTHQVYIGDFTNQDKSAEVYIISDRKKLHCHTIWREILMENGMVDTNAAFFGKCKASYDWTDKAIEEKFKKTLELSIIEFEIKGQ